MTRIRALAAAVPVLALPLLSACGGGASPAAAPSVTAAVPEDLSTPEGALAAVDHAEQSIDQLFGPTQSRVISQQAGSFAQAPASQAGSQPGQGAAPAQPAVPTPALPPPPPPPTVAEAAPPDAARSVSSHNAKKGGGEAPRGAATELDACSTACTALASMERATEHLCTLAGAADGRCTSARSRVKTATDRVRAACPTCG